MYTTIIHPLRKAFNLSISEYVILETIRGLMQKEEYNFWCVASKEYVSEYTDYSRATVFRCINSLEQKGLIYKNKKGHLRCRPLWIKYVTIDDIKMMAYNDILSLKMEEDSLKMRPTPSQNDTKQSQNDTPDSLKMRPNTNINIDSNTNKNTLSDFSKKSDLIKQPKKIKSRLSDTSNNIDMKDMKRRLKEIFINDVDAFTGEEFYWEAKHAVALNKIIDKIRFAYKSKGNDSPSEEQIENAFIHVLQKAKKDKWISDNYDLTIINSKWNIIIAKNGNKTHQAAREFLNQKD